MSELYLDLILVWSPRICDRKKQNPVCNILYTTKVTLWNQFYGFEDITAMYIISYQSVYNIFCMPRLSHVIIYYAYEYELDYSGRRAKAGTFYFFSKLVFVELSR